MSLIWSISEKWTFLGLIFPSFESESESESTSTLGFFSKDLSGVDLLVGRVSGFRSSNTLSFISTGIRGPLIVGRLGGGLSLGISWGMNSITVVSSIELSSSSSPVVGVGVTFPKTKHGLFWNIIDYSKPRWTILNQYGRFENKWIIRKQVEGFENKLNDSKNKMDDLKTRWKVLKQYERQTGWL